MPLIDTIAFLIGFVLPMMIIIIAFCFEPLFKSGGTKTLPTRQQALSFARKSLPVSVQRMKLGGPRCPPFFQQFIRNMKARRACEDHKRFLAFDAPARLEQLRKEIRHET